MSIQENQINPSLVVLKAFNNACKELAVSRDEAANIIGVDVSTLSRKKHKGIEPHSKNGELCLQFVRLYRSLFAIAGGDVQFMRHWMKTYNKTLSGKPCELMLSIIGLIQVNEYLDAMRGKI